ncbi:MAG TPA: hypothetical protein VMW72_02685 [Sedimentisphaerales bacterium]|nr:hypothetical protein [Sedimentisphaerales bacterium]
MSLKYKLMVIVILCLANCLICNIYASDSSTVSNDSPNSRASIQIVDEEHRSIANLRVQIDQQETLQRPLKEQNRNILDTIRLAIGFAPLFLVVVLGLISYLTHRQYEKDKFLLICIIKSEIAKIKSEIESRYSGLESSDGLQLKTKSFEQSIRNIAESITSEAIKPIDERTKLLMGSRLMLQMDISTLQAEQHVDKGQLTNAIRCWIDVAQKAWAVEWNWRVAHALDRINYLLNKGAKITLASSKTELNAFLQSLPPQFELLVKAIQSKI